MGARWRHGDVIARREVLGLDRVADRIADDDRPAPGVPERVWFALPVHVVADDDDQLVTYIAPGAEFGFVAGEWPTATTRHPWHGEVGWRGAGCLMVQRPGDEHAVWHFWREEDGAFLCWYVNFQAAFRRTGIGYDTMDFELDIVVFPDGTWTFKDREVLADRVAAGWLSQRTVDRVLALGDAMAAQLDAGRWPWDTAWAEWAPPEEWRGARLPTGWSAAP